MGFGLLLLGYISFLGVMPESFIYYSWGIYIAIAGGIIMLAGFLKLEEYNVYFKLMKYITVVYILILLGFTPFLIIYNKGVVFQNFMFVSKLIRICFLFVFHYILLTAISALAKEIGNFIIEKKAKRNIFITYIFFSAFVLEFIEIAEIILVMFFFGLVYFALTFASVYSCYMRITYEGRDEEIEKKYRLGKFKRKR